MAYTKAGQKAVDKYVKTNYDTIVVRVKKGKRVVVQDYAKANNTSVNALLIEYLNDVVPGFKD